MPTPDPNAELRDALSAIAGMMLDLYIKQIAIFDLLRQQSPIAPGPIRDALDRAKAQVIDHPALRSLRVGTDSSALTAAARVLQSLKPQ
jgi:hypothetical protein